MRTRRNDSGVTLIELTIVMALFSLLLAMVFTIMITLTYQAEDSLARARAVEQVRLGIAQIDRQVRSGNLIRDPADDSEADSGVPKYYSMRIYTQEGTGDPRCAQWRVYFDGAADKFGDLQFRSWEPDDLSSVTAWSIVAQNSVEPPLGTTPDPDNPKTWPPFWVDPSVNPGTVAQNIRITLRMNDPSADADAKAIAVSTIVTGRNTVFGYSDTFCDPAPNPNL